jgi:peptidoglycan/LPS O-acetylase OafA/YrhL
MKYRKDIQILRGVSILLVVFFHINIPGFGSGFLGVDIFFVISGFLMAGLYNPAHTRDFYLKRARRILPAYFVVILLTLLVCMALTTPNDFEQVITQSFFALTFSSNIGFWFENSYFDKAAFKPLLHLWSLGVEIQFYLLVPLFHRLIARYKVVGYAVLFACSLAACIFTLGISPKTSFFMMPLRLWEFMVGYGVALHVSRRPRDATACYAWAGALGLALLVLVPMVCNLNGVALGFLLGHPGFYAMVVALGAGVVLVTGFPQRLENFRVAGWLEKLGQYSYSAYLVHFPVIVLFLYQPFSGTVLKPGSNVQLLVLLALIAALSIVMFRFVETPMRSGRRALPWLAGVALAVLVLGPAGQMFHKLKFSPKEMAVFGAWTDRGVYRCGKMIRLLEPSVRSCEITTKLANPQHRILLVGDSHSDSIKTSFKAAAESQNVAVWFLVENNPLREGGTTPEVLIREAELKGLGTIFMHFSPGGVDPLAVEKVVSLAAAKGINVSFILPVPVWKQHIPMALYRNLTDSAPLPAMNMAQYQEADRALEDSLAKIHAGNFSVYPVAAFFCRPDCQLADASWKPLYFDNSHLTLTGGELLRPLFTMIMQNGQ